MSDLDAFFGIEVADAIRAEIALALETNGRDHELLTIPAFAAEFGLPVKTVRNLVDRKRLEAVRLGGRVLIPRSAGRQTRC